MIGPDAQTIYNGFATTERKYDLNMIIAKIWQILP